MLGNFTNDADDSFASNYATLVTNLFYGCLYFHDVPLLDEILGEK